MSELVGHETIDVPQPRSCPFAAPAEYEQLRQRGSISRVRTHTGQLAWAVTRFDDIRAVLNDTRFSSDRSNPGFPLRRSTSAQSFTPSLIGMDPPEHGTARRAVVGEFTVKRMRALQPRIQEIVDERLDQILAGPRPVDLVQALSLPVPSLVICELLGVPYRDHEFFQRCSARLVSRVLDDGTRSRAIADLRSYLDELVSSKEAEPGCDLISRQIGKQREDYGQVDHDALVSLAFLLLVAGHETTANMISLGTVALLEHPEQLAVITNDPSKTPNAVEELLRYFTIAELATSRVATEDVQLAGTRIRAGEGVIALATVGNRDAEVFERPDELDVERGTRSHLAFGYGPHQCLGQNLARLELRIVFDALFRRIPGLRLAKPVDELPFKDDAAVYGLHELPVTW